MSHTRAIHQVTIMRRSFPATLAAAFLLFLPPLVPAAAQTGRDSTSERTEARDYAVDEYGNAVAEPIWEASIRASELNHFCRALISLLEHTLE